MYRPEPGVLCVDHPSQASQTCVALEQLPGLHVLASASRRLDVAGVPGHDDGYGEGPAGKHVLRQGRAREVPDVLDAFGVQVGDPRATWSMASTSRSRTAHARSASYAAPGWPTGP